MSLRIRAAGDADRDAIRQVTLAAYQEYASVLGPAHWKDYRENIISALAEVKPEMQIVAEEDRRILGTVMLYPQHMVEGPDGKPRIEAPYVRLLAVVPEARSRGIGKALMQECIDRARESGAKVIQLHSTDIMRAAIQMYERIGFKRVPEFDFQPAPGYTAKGYRLQISNE